MSPEKSKRFQIGVQGFIDDYWPSTAPPLAPLWKRGNNWDPKDNRLPIEQALQMLVTACFILICGLSARRRMEVDSLLFGCSGPDAFGQHWLSSYIEKTLRDIDKIPVPASVTFAVKLMHRLSSKGRAKTGKSWIFQVLRPSAASKATSHNFIDLRLPRAINVFADLVEVPRNPDQADFSFEVRQLRRAFAIYYYHGNRFKSLDALSRFFGHYDPEMTRRYITEISNGTYSRMHEVTRANGILADEARRFAVAPALDDHFDDALSDQQDRASLFNDVRKESYVDRTLEMYDGMEEPYGLGAVRWRADLNEMIETALRKVSVGSRSNAPPAAERIALISILRVAAENKYLEPHPGQHVHCGCRPRMAEDLLSAACLTNKIRLNGEIDDQMPDYAYASISDCLGCHHGIVLSENESRIEDYGESLVVASACGNLLEVRQAATRRYSELCEKVFLAKLALKVGK